MASLKPEQEPNMKAHPFPVAAAVLLMVGSCLLTSTGPKFWVGLVLVVAAYLTILGFISGFFARVRSWVEAIVIGGT